jgi:hypothetical protein
MLRRLLLVAVIAIAFTGSLYTTIGCSPTPTEAITPTTNLSGTVRDAVTGALITNKPNAVEVSQGRSLVVNASIASDGTFFVSGLNTGSATVAVVVSGYKDFSMNITLTNGTSNLDIRLQPAT